MKLLDTNICIAIIRKDPKAIQQLRLHDGDQLFIPTIVQAELYLGVYLSDKPNKTRREVEELVDELEEIGFSSAAARRYGQLRASLQKQGSMIGPNDLIVASIALAESYILVTHNTKEFSRVPGLKLEDWLN